jgi:hypothetical protein
MTPAQPIRATRAGSAVACLATLVLALAACGATPPTGSSAASLKGSPGTEPSSASSTPTGVPSTGPLPSAMALSPSPASTPGPSAAHQPLTIHLILHPINDTVGSLTGCSNAGTCQGDFMVGYDPLFDAAIGKEVGTFAYECFLVDVASTRYHCPDVTITLTGRGQIVFTEVIEHEPDKPPAIAPITGGTGEFLGATGEVTARVLPGAGDFVITLTK